MKLYSHICINYNLQLVFLIDITVKLQVCDMHRIFAKKFAVYYAHVHSNFINISRIKYGSMKSKNLWIKFKVKGDPSIEMAALGIHYEPGQN